MAQFLTALAMNWQCSRQKMARPNFCAAAKDPLAEGEAIDEIAPIRPANPGEAWITPAQVNYVGLAANLYDMGYKWVQGVGKA